MKNILSLSILVILTLAVHALTPVKGSLSPTGQFRVIRIYDGDTFTILDPNGLKTYNIRINGIDAPERTQEYGLYARAFLEQLIDGKPVKITPIGIDIWGRTTATCYDHQGHDIALEMLKAGMAWHYTQYSSNQKYAEAEKMARCAHTGLWCRTNPMNPQDYRHAPRDIKRKNQ